MTKSTFKWICLGLGILTLSAVMASSQDHGAAIEPSSQSDSGYFFESVDVTVVNVDVYVTDKKGNRVTGLTAEDFEIFEDRRPMRISNFFAVDKGRPVIQTKPPGTEAEKASAPDSIIPPQVAARQRKLPENQRLYLILYFDNLYLRPFNRNKVVDHAREFVATRLVADDEVMLVTFDRSLHIRQPFTSDRNVIESALKSIEKLSGFAVQAASQRQEVIRSIDISRSAFEALDHADFYAKNIFFEVNQSINALKEVVLSMAGLPGRKALLYVSDGLPMRAASDLFNYVDLRFPGSPGGLLQSSRYKADRQFKVLSSIANSNRVTFYTLEAAGLRSHASLSAEYGGTVDRTSMLEIDVTNTMNLQEPLQEMARLTGGLATFNTNNIRGGMDRMAEDFRSYYSLGYVPSNAGDGRYYKLEVKTKDRTLKVRHRDGYRAKSPETRITEGTLAALFFGRESNPLGFSSQFEPHQPQNNSNFLVPLLVKIPISNITLIPREAFHQGSLQVTVAVMDDDGKLSPVDLKTVPISIPAADLEQALRQEFVYEIQLLMRRGPQEVAVGVYDDFSRESSFLRSRVQVGG